MQKNGNGNDHLEGETVRRESKVNKPESAVIEKILANVEDLHMLPEEESDRVDHLRNECPSDWSSLKTEIDEGGIDNSSKYEETWAYIGKASPDSIPG